MRGGPAASGVTGRRSIPLEKKNARTSKDPGVGVSQNEVAGPTRLELATSGVTGRRSNQLNYDPARVLTLN